METVHRLTSADTIRELEPMFRKPRASFPLSLFFGVSDQVYYSKLEEYVIALMAAKRVDEAERVLEKHLYPQFPPASYSRSNILKGRVFEAKGEYSEALKLYEGILKEDPFHLGARKRVLAVYAEQASLDAPGSGQKELLVKALSMGNSILDLTPDRDVMLVMYELYIRVGDFERSLFCVEEALLLEPMHPMLNCLAAECCVCIGSVDALRTARKYAARACELTDGEDTRCLAVLSAIVDKLMDQKCKDEVNEQLKTWVTHALSARSPSSTLQ
eukprot:ANDGO_01467.mRNA.1 ER membrane protein complex subunit 2